MNYFFHKEGGDFEFTYSKPPRGLIVYFWP